MGPAQIERFCIGCLAHASYMIGSEGVAAVIDPQRDVDIYIEAAARLGWLREQVLRSMLAGVPESCSLMLLWRTVLQSGSAIATCSFCVLPATAWRAFVS